MEIAFKKAQKLKDHPDESSLGFGTNFTDYMFNMDYNPEKGWHNPRIEPYGPMEMDPSTMVLHYGQTIFEGLKAYRTESGAVQLVPSARQYQAPQPIGGQALHAGR